MVILVIDNYFSRHKEFNELLGEIYSDYEIVFFADPFFAVQYCMKNKVDIVFIQSNIRPISYVNVSNLIHKFNEDTKVILIGNNPFNLINIDETAYITEYIENPLNRENLENLKFCMDNYDSRKE